MDSASNKRRNAAEGVTPPARLVARIRRLVELEGEPDVALMLGIARATVTRLRGGLPCRAGTIALAAQRLGMSGGER
jgi:hypothetical protein